ncbi:MAG: histidine--tRNA ligase, partial [Thermoleophilaceae bacterium]
QAPRGTFDVLGDDALARDHLEATARGILEAAGYARIETPTFESTALFARGVGESTDVVQKEMYTFDSGDESESLTLRPEGTAPVCRAYLEHGMHKRPQPVKLWYWGPYFRHEAPQAGRFRQFTQVGAEALGSDDPALDAELIWLLADLLDLVAARDIRLRISSLGTAETRREYAEELKAFLTSREDELAPEVKARIDTNPLRAFDSADASTQGVMRDAPKLLDRLAPDDAEHFDAVRRLLDEVGIAYEVDPALVRGLDYYTRTVFEFTSDALGAQSGVGGGGRYDGLVEQLGGPPTPGVGWAAGIERILLAGGVEPAAWPILFVAVPKPERREAAFRVAYELRRGMPVELGDAGRSLKGQLKRADQIGAAWTVIVEDEGLTLKHMESGDQRTVATADEVLKTVIE